MSIQLKKVVRRYTPRKTMSHKTLDSVPPMRTTPIVVRPKAGKCSYRILTFTTQFGSFFLKHVLVYIKFFVHLPQLIQVLTTKKNKSKWLEIKRLK